MFSSGQSTPNRTPRGKKIREKEFFDREVTLKSIKKFLMTLDQVENEISAAKYDLISSKIF